jgi:ATP-dependent helicase/nuclease subunit A
MSSAGETNWTPSQRAALEHVDGALLVSAAAGSGKTAVLAARCAYLVCDAPEPCDVDELLVLTFTRAAAAEMKERIDAALRKRAEQSDADERILRQLRLIDRAAITTIDAFCGQLVREHFHLVGVDPGFALLAPEDAGLLRSDVASDLIEAEFDAPATDVFRTLLDGYFGSDTDRLREALIRAHVLSQTIADPAAWMMQSIDRLRAATGDGPSELVDRFSAIQRGAIAAAVEQLAFAAARADAREGLAAYASHAREMQAEFETWLELSEAGDMDALATRVREYAVPKLPTIRGERAGKEAIKAAINGVKDRAKKGGELLKLLRWTRAELRAAASASVPVAERFISLLARFTSNYDQAKRSLRSLDFADVEANALKILRDGDRPSATARAMQARYRHVLVDEFQDINPLQFALLRLVSRDRAAELDDTVRSNLFSVGDVKQSIYRFRLAEPQQFIDRRALLIKPGSPFGRVIDLQENFRSRAPLLEAVNDVFRRLMTEASTNIEYDATHELKSIKDYAAVEQPSFAGKPIELHLLPREMPASDDDAESSEDAAESDGFEREVAFIAQRIRKLVEIDRPNVTVTGPNGAMMVRPARYGDVVVLLRSARFKSSQVADALRTRGMPVHSDDATGFFTAVEVQDVLSVLRVLSNQRQDVPLAAVLRSPLFDFSAREDLLATIRIAFPDEPFHRAVVRYAGERQDEVAQELKRVLDRLAVWRRMFRERPVADSLRHLLEFNGFDAFCRARQDGAQRLANLNALLARAKAFDAFERQGLDRFLTFLEELEAGDELGRPSLGAESDDVVRVMTIHKSKGLEFPIVVIPDLGKKFNTASLNDAILIDRDLGIGMTAVDLKRRIRYPSLSSIVVREHVARQAVAEEIRVLYVALTRAREHLVLVGTAGSRAVEAWRDVWADHEGALPDDVVQDAGTPLDWIGPIAVMTDSAGLGTFALVDHSTIPSDESSSPPIEHGPSTEVSISQARDVALTDPLARLAVERIGFAYPHESAAKQRATLPVTQFVALALPEVQLPHESGTTLDWPAAYRPRERASAADIGTATHLLLQLLDLRAAQTAAEIRAQADRFIERRLMTSRDASLVDLDSIVWLLQTDLGELMRRPDARVKREQPLAIALPPLGLQEPRQPDRGDRILVRGRVDVLVETPEGLTLIDYKSDRVDADATTERAARYGPQLWGYGEAIQAITGFPVRRASLVFLRPRKIVDVPMDGLKRPDVP